MVYSTYKNGDVGDGILLVYPYSPKIKMVNKVNDDCLNALAILRLYLISDTAIYIWTMKSTLALIPFLSTGWFLNVQT